jgi:hypothetical protein
MSENYTGNKASAQGEIRQNRRAASSPPPDGEKILWLIIFPGFNEMIRQR